MHRVPAPEAQGECRVHARPNRTQLSRLVRNSVTCNCLASTVSRTTRSAAIPRRPRKRELAARESLRCLLFERASELTRDAVRTDTPRNSKTGFANSKQGSCSNRDNNRRYRLRGGGLRFFTTRTLPSPVLRRLRRMHRDPLSPEHHRHISAATRRRAAQRLTMPPCQA